MNNILSSPILHEPTYKFIFLTPLLYPNNRGFTIWNICNIVISQLYKNNDKLNKFNANNSAAALFGSLIYYITSPVEFQKWLEQENFSHLSEKLVHSLPFIYYLYNGHYNFINIKISLLSALYEFIWSYKTGKNIINKEDIYYRASYKNVWYFIWSFIIYGHFFTTKSISKLGGLVCSTNNRYKYVDYK